MKRLILFLFLTSLLFSQQQDSLTFSSANDPWQPYELGNKKLPVVPEPATYGFVMTGSVLAIILFLKRRKN